MMLRININEALESLSSAKQRTVLALIGIIIGIGSVIGMISIGEIVKNQALKQFEDMGINIITVSKDYDSPNKMVTFPLSGTLALGKHVPGIASVAPYIVSGTQFSHGSKNAFIDMLGVTQSFFDICKLTVREGRLISDLDSYRYFCIIGSDFADSLQKSGTKNVLGSDFKFGKRIYTVIGVINKVSEGGGMLPGGLNKGVITHITTASRSFEERGINTFLARLKKIQPVPVLQRELNHYFGAKQRGLTIKVSTAEQLIEGMGKQMRLFTLLLGAIGSISLIVGGVGVMNVMLVSVTERRKEIGIRRALGAQQSDIQSQFIIESVTLCLAGGIIGILLGITVSYIFAYFAKWDFIVSYAAILLGVGVSTAVGVFSGFYPAREAARVDPITALRGE
ncbi:MAG: ABC transporter permease [Proteobacteria bacterium]|nr:ABC transporter permease [Pseudomonadota bacterium]